MKKALFIYSIDGALIFISTIIGSIILTLLRISNKIDNQGYNITVLVVSNVIFLLGGLFLGLKVKQKGLLNGFIFATIYTIIALLFNFLALEKADLTDTIEILIKDVILIFSSLIGVNISRK
jgi:putative membrane protein (TIGR04086 family)